MDVRPTFDGDSAWWRGAVIYQIYPRSFFDSNGDGVGDLPGITARLDYVARLGVDAIWLCPFFVSPMKDFGYDVSDHLDVDPIFGTLEDFDALVDRAHALGLRVLIDQVWSHTSNRHPWFIESRASRANAKADWYVWADPSPDGTPPNNWLSVFGGSAWSWEPRRRQYYLHHFLSDQPCLNLRTPAVMDAVLEGGRFWLERGVDGFRLDAIDFMAHDPGLRDNPPAPIPADGVPAKLFAMQRHVHDMLHEDSRALMRRIRGLMDQHPGSVTLGEVSSQPGALDRVVGYTLGSEHLHMAYTLRPLRGGYDWPTVRQMLLDMQAAGDDGWVCWSFSNHDVERAVSRWNPRRGDEPPDPAFARQLMALLLSLRGSVSLYQGEELGLTEAELQPEQLRDPFGIAYWPEFRGRDGSRTPIPWEQSVPHGGFTTAQNPWLPVPDEHHEYAVSAQEDDPDALIHSFRRFLAWRAERPALRYGTMHPLPTSSPLIAFERRYGDDRVLAFFNLSDTPATADLSGFTGVEPLEESGFAAVIDGPLARLPPHGVFFATVASAQSNRAVALACA